MELIFAALQKLDVANDNHWTADGLPRLDTVKMLAADPSLGREAVEAAAPGFTRATALGYALPAPGSAVAGAAATLTAPPPPPPAADPLTAPVKVEGAEDATFSPKPPEQPSLAVGSVDSTDALSTLEEDLVEADAHIEKVHQALDMVTKELKESNAHRDAILTAMDKLRPQDTNTNAIQMYLARQRKILEERAARKQLIKDSGLDLAELAKGLKSPIDAAMARNRARGRPGV